MKFFLATLLSLITLSSFCETIHSFNDTGTVTTENSSFYSLLIDYKINRGKNIQYLFKVNTSGKTVTGERKKEYCILNFNSMPVNSVLKAGINEITGSTPSNIELIAWDNPGLELRSVISQIVNQYSTELDYKLSSRLKTAAKIINLREIITSRIEHLSLNIKNSEENLQKLTEALDTSKTGLEEMKSSKISKDNEAKKQKDEAQKLDEEIHTKEEQLKDQFSSELDKEIKELKIKQEDLVKNIETLHLESYKLEDDIRLTENMIKSLQDDINNYPGIISNYKKELEERNKNLAELNKANTSQQQGTTVIDNSETIYVKDDDDSPSFGEMFGIACIPACGIVLPVGLLYSTAYTEVRLSYFKSKEQECTGEEETDDSTVNIPVDNQFTNLMEEE